MEDIKNTSVENTEITTSTEEEEVKTYTQEEVLALLQKESDKRVTEALKKQQKKYEKQLSLSKLAKLNSLIACLQRLLSEITFCNTIGLIRQSSRIFLSSCNLTFFTHFFKFLLFIIIMFFYKIYIRFNIISNNFNFRSNFTTNFIAS